MKKNNKVKKKKRKKEMFFALAENCNHPRMLCGTFQGGLETETIMADPAWKDDLNPREEMETYVRQGYKREEALDFLKRDFPQYSWSIRSLDRRLRYFAIYYNDQNVSVDLPVKRPRNKMSGSS